MTRDYSQEGDPYGIRAEYTGQSATTESVTSGRSAEHDVRGNTLTAPRGIPTQEEADAIAREARR